MNKLIYKLIHRLLTLNPKFYCQQLKKQVEESYIIRTRFPTKNILQQHFPMRNTLRHPDVFITQLRFLWLYNRLQDLKGSILNIGDSSGILLKALNRIGVSLNIDEKTVEFIQEKGMVARFGNIEDLPFEDKSFDYILCFQTLEHLPSPIKALQEMARVMRRQIFVSIPYASKTVVYSLTYWNKLLKTSWGVQEPKMYDGHIIEFSKEDFLKLLSYANLKCEENCLIEYFDNKTRIRRLMNKYVKSYFNFFVLCNGKTLN